MTATMDTTDVIKVTADDSASTQLPEAALKDNRQVETDVQNFTEIDTERHNLRSENSTDEIQVNNNVSHKAIDNSVDLNVLPYNDKESGSSSTTALNQTDNKVAFIKIEPPDDDSRSNKCVKGITHDIKLVADYQDEDDSEEDMDSNDKEKEIQVLLEVNKVKQKPAVIDVKSDTSDSSSDSSDSEESSSSDDDSSSISLSSDTDVEEAESAKIDNTKTTKKKGPKAGLDEVPNIVYPDIVLPEDVTLIEMGQIASIIGQLVVVNAKPDIPALNLDTVLFKQNRQAMGAVFDVFGPVVSPMYSVAFNSAEDIVNQKVILNMPVFFAPHIKDITAYVFTDKLREERGSDASWKNDEEPPLECLDYSDDEQERMAKNKKQDGKEGRRRKKPQRRERMNSEPTEDVGRQQPRQRGQRQQWQRNHPRDNGGHYRGPPLRHDNNRQFLGDGCQFPPRPRHPQGPPPPPCPPHPPHPPQMFPPGPPGFMGGAQTPPLPLYNNGPPMGPLAGQFKQGPFGPPGPFHGPPPPQGTFQNGVLETKPVIPFQQNSQCSMGGGMWQPPPPPRNPPPPPTPPNFGPPGPAMASWPPPPGFNNLPMFPPPPPPPPTGPPY